MTATTTREVTPGVESAIADLVSAFGTGLVRIRPDGSGGAFVVIEQVDIGAGFAPRTSWIGFQIVWSCPDADTYPHFIDPAVRYVGLGPAPVESPDGNLPAAISRGHVMPGFDQPAIQVSRRSYHHDAATDTPLWKLMRVLEFLRSR